MTTAILRKTQGQVNTNSARYAVREPQHNFILAVTAEGEAMTKEEARRKGIELQKAFGLAIKNARERRKLTQVALGDSGNISRLESGKQWAEPVILVLLSQTLSVPIWRLFAEAEGAIRGAGLDLLEVYQQSDEQGRQLINHAVGLAKRYHLRPPNLRADIASC